ncbi:MAG TPA: hypothetical protein VK050_06445 [Flavobacteriaceae bacterium]|nr:hypothetical protein [Flavobacteriaceae bacterium]
MSKNRSFYGQLNWTRIKYALQSGKIKAQRIQTKHGEQIFFDINVWVNDEPDQYGQDASVQMQLSKEAYEAKEKNPYYIGNLKFREPTATDVSPEEIKNIVGGEEDDDLSF